MPGADPRRGVNAWASMAIALALGAVALWFAPREALDWQAPLAWSPWHLQANLLGCAVVAVFGIAAGLPPRATWAWLAAWPLTHVLLALQAQLLHYGGLSGLLHAGVAIAALELAWQGRGRRRLIGGAVLAGLAAKLLLEQPWIGPTQGVAGWDFRVAPVAHLNGAVAGLVCGAVAQAIARGRPGALG
jgi:hypothetical protein